MIACGLQMFSVLFLCALTSAADAMELQPGSVQNLVFRDVDGNNLATADGHVTVITVVTRENETKARAIADLVPDRYVGERNFRYVTLVNFQGKLFRPVHGLTRAVIRSRLEAEAKKLQPKYAAKKINRDPRGDIYVIPDFDGSAVARLGLPQQLSEIVVFVFNGKGRLVERWKGVPPGDALAKAIADAE